jgi:hypothetical protein
MMKTHEESIGRPHRPFDEQSWYYPSKFTRPLMDKLFPAHPTNWSVGLALGAFVALGLVLSILFLAIVKPTYTASMVIGPTQEQFSSSPSNQLDRNALSLLSGGGLLSGPRVITPYDAFLKTIQTREVADRLFADPEIRAGLFPGAWDSATKSWKQSFSPKSALVGVLYWLVGRHRPTQPTADTVEEVLKNSVNVGMIERGPMYTLTYSATNREFAMDFLHRSFVTADRIVKNRNLKQVLERIQILKNRMNSLDVVDYRSQFINLLMDQEKQLMVLQGNMDFAASVVVPPSAPDYPDSPRLFVTAVLFMALFFLLGVSILVLIYREMIMARIRPSSR